MYSQASAGRSGLPRDHTDGDLGMLAYQGLGLGVLLRHLFELGQALLELLASGRVLSNRRDELHVVEPSLLLQIVQKLNDEVELVEVVNLNFALLELGKRSQRSDRASPNVADCVSQHLTERLDAVGFDSLALPIIVE